MHSASKLLIKSLGPSPEAYEVVEVPALPEQVCTDADDDKFLACAIGSATKLIVTGDKALLRTSGYQGVIVLKPRDFVDRYLKKK